MKISIIDFHQSSPSALKMMKVKDSSNKQQTNNTITRTTTTTTNYFNPKTSKQHQFCSSFTFNKPTSNTNNQQQSKSDPNGRGKIRKNNTPISPQQLTFSNLPNVMTGQEGLKNVSNVISDRIVCSSPPLSQQDQQFRWNVNMGNQSNKIVKRSHQSRKTFSNSQAPTMSRQQTCEKTTSPQLVNSPSTDGNSSNIFERSICAFPTESDHFLRCPLENQNKQQLPSINNFPNLLSFLPSDYNSNRSGSTNANCKPSYRTSISLAEILN